jgi:hypothetical protein
MAEDNLLQVSGSRIVTRSGQPALLHGIGLGGWMNMENFITGHPATETLMGGRDADRPRIVPCQGAAGMGSPPRRAMQPRPRSRQPARTRRSRQRRG